jgi:hypothetical protein|tara:strand:+ start:260 stop:655 length:396 start_codon:yes stop_codon:yes gene_type:complete
MANTQKMFALIVGIVLALIGVWGFFTDSILGIFGVNAFQSVLHIIAGAIGIYAGTKGEGVTYNKVIGWIAVALGILGFIPVVKDLLLSLLNINLAITVLHLVLGVIAVMVARSAGSSPAPVAEAPAEPPAQ